MAEEGWVDIIHTETGMTSTVHPSAVPAWETAGWKVTDSASAPAGAPTGWTGTDNGSEESGQQMLPQGDLLDQTPGAAPSGADEE